MVKYKTIIKTIENYIKCHEYPKAIALKNFNPENFHEEEISTTDRFAPGTFEEWQRELQSNVEYTEIEKCVVGLYNSSSFSALQKYLNGDESWKEEVFKFSNGHYGVFASYPTYDLVDDGNGHMIAENYKMNHNNLTMKQYSETLHDICDKSPTLAQNTVLYRWGRLPLGTNGEIIGEGGHGRFKGFIGACFGEEHLDGILDQLTQWGNSNTRYKLKIYAPEGTKGVTMTHECGAENPYQNEFLLDKGQRFIILSRNDKTKEASILLY